MRLRHLPFEDLGFAKIDHHRALRQGFPEVIMGQGKQAKDIAAIVRAMRRRNANILVTRVDAMQMAQLKRLRTGLKFHSSARAATWSGAEPIKIIGKGTVLVVCAGTSDIPVAEEAALTATDDGQSGRAALSTSAWRAFIDCSTTAIASTPLQCSSSSQAWRGRYRAWSAV